MAEVSTIIESRDSKGTLSSKIFYIAVAALFVIFSFSNGLFFDRSFMIAACFWFVLTLVFYLWIRKTRVTFGGWQIVDYLVFSYLFLNLLSCFWPANVEFAVLGAVRIISYFALYVFVRVIVSIQDREELILDGLILSGAVFGLYGLANGFGTLNIDGAIFDPQMRRLASNFEYANTFAIYQAIISVFSIAMTAFTTSKIKKYLYVVAGYIVITSVVLTYSRGVWLVMAGMILFYLLLSPRTTKVQIAGYICMLVFALFSTLPFLSKAIMETRGVLGWGTIFVGIGTILFLTWLLSFARKRLSIVKWKSQLLLIGIIVVLGATGLIFKIGLPHNFMQRLSSINFEQFSVVQRFVFYQDGLKVLKEHPLLGYGPQAWRALYQRYQSYPYVSRQSHSLLIDTIMNVGVLGTLAFVGLLCLVIWTFYRSYRSYSIEARILQSAIFCGLFGLVVHGFIDFDFSYGIINFLMWMLIALLLPGLSVKRGSILSTKYQTTGLQKSLTYIGAALSTLGIIVAVGYLLSDRYLEVADRNQQISSVALSNAEKATAVAPYRASAWMYRAKYEENNFREFKDTKYKTAIITSVNRAIALSPHDPEVLALASKYVAQYSGLLNAEEIAGQAWENGRYKMQYPELYIYFSDKAGTQLYRQDKNKSKLYFNRALEIYQDVEKRILNFKDLNPVLHLEYKYEITPSMRLSAGEAYYYLGKYDDAIKTIEPVLTTASKQDQALAKAILSAIYEKQGKQVSQDWISTLIKNGQLAAYYKELTKVDALK